MAPKRPPPTHKATPSAVQTRQKAKKVVSTSALFAQIPKLKAAQSLAHVSDTKRVSAVKQLQPQTRRMVAVVIPKKDANHPLMTELNDTTTSYTTDLLSSASSKLVSTHNALIKQLDKATPDTLFDPSIKALRKSLCKPLHPTPAIVSLRSIIEKEGQVLLDLKKEYASLNSSIGSFAGEILQVPSQGQGNREGREKEGEVQGERLQLHLVHIAKVTEMAGEISVLGAEEIREMDVENKAQAKKRAEIARFFQGLDEDVDVDEE